MNDLGGFGITLRVMTREDIPGVAPRRDDPRLMEILKVDEPVTDEVLCRWLDSLEGSGFCALVLWRGEPVGLTVLTDHDAARRTATESR